VPSSLPDTKSYQTCLENLGIWHLGGSELAFCPLLAHDSTGKMASFVVDSKVLERSEKELIIIPGKSGSSLFTGPPNTDMLTLKLVPLS